MNEKEFCENCNIKKQNKELAIEINNVRYENIRLNDNEHNNIKILNLEDSNKKIEEKYKNLAKNFQKLYLSNLRKKLQIKVTETEINELYKENRELRKTIQEKNLMIEYLNDKIDYRNHFYDIFYHEINKLRQLIEENDRN